MWCALSKGLARYDALSLYVFFQSSFYYLHLFILFCSQCLCLSCAITSELFLGVSLMSMRAACIPDFGGVFFTETVAMHHLLNQDQK